MQSRFTPEATRFRDLKQRLILLVGCHIAMATVLMIEVLVAGEPYSAGMIVATQIVIALLSVSILIGVRRNSTWPRIPLLTLCIVSLPQWPLSFFALGILWLLCTGPRPRPLTPEFQTDLVRRREVRASLDDWNYLLGVTFCYLAAWAFVHAPYSRM